MWSYILLSAERIATQVFSHEYWIRINKYNTIQKTERLMLILKIRDNTIRFVDCLCYHSFHRCTHTQGDFSSGNSPTSQLVNWVINDFLTFYNLFLIQIRFLGKSIHILISLLSLCASINLLYIYNNTLGPMHSFM